MAEGNVFVSYRRSDAAGYALLLNEKLSEAFGDGIVFIDVDEIDPGDDFVSTIDERLARSRVLLALMGRGWAQSRSANGKGIEDAQDFVRREIGSALARKGIAVIPVLLGGASMPRADELPEELRGLVRRNAVEVRETRFPADVEGLITAIRKHLEAEPGEVGSGGGWRALLGQALGFAATTAFVAAAAWTSFFNAFGADDAVEGFLLGRFEAYALPPSGRGLFLIAASEKAGANGPLVEPLGDAWRRHHARLIEILAGAGARVVAFDLEFEGPSDANDDLATAAREAEKGGTSVVLAVPQVDAQGQPIHPLARDFAGLPWGITEGSPGRRRMRLAAPVRSSQPAWAQTTQLVPSLALETLAQYRRREQGLAEVRAHASARPDWLQLRSAGRVVEEIPVVDQRLNMIVFPPLGQGFLDPLRYHQVLGSRGDAAGLATFKGAVVLVGFEARSDLLPVAGHDQKRYGMQFQGMAVAQLLERLWVRRPTLGEQFSGIVLLAAIGFAIQSPSLPFHRRRLRLALPKPIDRTVHVSLALLAGLVLYFLLALALYRWRRIVVHATYDVAALLLAYAVAGWIRRRRLLEPAAA